MDQPHKSVNHILWEQPSRRQEVRDLSRLLSPESVVRELALRDVDRVALQFSDSGALGVRDLAGLDEIHSGFQES